MLKNNYNKRQHTQDNNISSNSQKRAFVATNLIHLDDNALLDLKKRYIAFDVETTGFSSSADRIIEVGAVLFESGEIKKTYSSLINISIPIPAAASAVNHITNDMIRNAPSESIVYKELVEFLGNALDKQTIICAHNARFDMGFLSETLMRLGYNGTINYTDTLSLSRKLVKGLANYKQDTIASHFGLINRQSHRAVSDAEICGKILWNLIQLMTYKSTPAVLYGDMLTK